MHGVAATLTHSEPTSDADQAQKDIWTHANKVCRHTFISTLSNDLFDVHCIYKEAHKIRESLILKYTAEDAGKQKFVVGNFYKWEMTEEKDIKLQINEYHKLLEELRAEKINLPDEFVASILIEKLPKTWNTNRKAIQAAKGKEIAAKANLMELKPRSKRYDSKNKNNKNKKSDYKSKDSNPKFKKKGDDGSDDKVIAAVVSQALVVTDVKKWVVDSGATKHICANREMFTSFEEGEDHIYFANSQTTKVQGKGKVVLKLTSGKTLALNDVLYVPDVRANLVSVALLGKAGVRVSFESDKVA
ncbi:uncharacterized protein LOC114713060 [Neltuma alba]|uniref:uncharacterized protein LOC114713060 n=1 Tax=Neltuma alba TaxID=207710 RepID=UPI0010A3E363|nr:uncharacterized protein LOC114713060 [Prosopis alba]